MPPSTPLTRNFQPLRAEELEKHHIKIVGWQPDALWLGEVSLERCSYRR